MTPEIRARIEADMAAASRMEFRELVGFLAGYSAKFDGKISRGEVLRESVRAYADEALERVRRDQES